MNATEDPQVLVLNNVSSADQGWYTCLAANSIGTSSSTAYLTVLPGTISWVLDILYVLYVYFKQYLCKFDLLYNHY
jgi:hypothetical protein